MSDFKERIKLVYHLKEKDSQKPERQAKEYRPPEKDNVIYAKTKFDAKRRGN